MHMDVRLWVMLSGSIREDTQSYFYVKVLNRVQLIIKVQCLESP